MNNKGKTAILTVRVPWRLLAQIQGAAQQDERTVSDVVRLSIKAGLPVRFGQIEQLKMR